MAINAYGNNLATEGAVGTASNVVKDKTILGKDDFMKLLLVELQHQDPTEPMDSEKILGQTSQLATLEASENTNKALSDLAKSLQSSQQFSTISAIGKTADLGSNAIGYDKGTSSTFEIYFPEDIANGTVQIVDVDGKTVSTIDIKPNESGVYQFDWNGKLSDGAGADSGMYYVSASYNNSNGDALTTRMGTYPIESVRFDEGKTLVKVGSSYVPLESIVEVY